MSRISSILLSGFVACGVIVAPGRDGFAAESARNNSVTAPASAVSDLFEAEERQQVSIQYIPNNSKSAQIIVPNRTRSPQTLRLPAAFAGVPVLAQRGGGMGGAGLFEVY